MSARSLKNGPATPVWGVLSFAAPSRDPATAECERTSTCAALRWARKLIALAVARVPCLARALHSRSPPRRLAKGHDEHCAPLLCAHPPRLVPRVVLVLRAVEHRRGRVDGRRAGLLLLLLRWRVGRRRRQAAGACAVPPLTQPSRRRRLRERLRRRPSDRLCLRAAVQALVGRVSPRLALAPPALLLLLPGVFVGDDEVDLYGGAAGRRGGGPGQLDVLHRSSARERGAKRTGKKGRTASGGSSPCPVPGLEGLDPPLLWPGDSPPRFPPPPPSPPPPSSVVRTRSSVENRNAGGGGTTFEATLRRPWATCLPLAAAAEDDEGGTGHCSRKGPAWAGVEVEEEEEEDEEGGGAEGGEEEDEWGEVWLADEEGVGSSLYGPSAWEGEGCARGSATAAPRRASAPGRRGRNTHRPPLGHGRRRTRRPSSPCPPPPSHPRSPSAHSPPARASAAWRLPSRRRRRRSSSRRGGTPLPRCRAPLGQRRPLARGKNRGTRPSRRRRPSRPGRPLLLLLPSRGSRPVPPTTPMRTPRLAAASGTRSSGVHGRFERRRTQADSTSPLPSLHTPQDPPPPSPPSTRPPPLSRPATNTSSPPVPHQRTAAHRAAAAPFQDQHAQPPTRSPKARTSGTRCPSRGWWSGRRSRGRGSRRRLLRRARAGGGPCTTGRGRLRGGRGGQATKGTRGRGQATERAIESRKRAKRGRGGTHRSRTGRRRRTCGQWQTPASQS